MQDDRVIGDSAGEVAVEWADETARQACRQAVPSSDTDRDAATTRKTSVPAWDLPTRVFHWLLAALIVSAYLTNKFGGVDLYWHRLNGYAILTLVLFRVFWGFVGGSTARFSSFVGWPWRAAGYALGLIKGRSKQYLGHNPLGGWVVLLLLGLLAFQGITGLFSNDDVLAEGPLVKLVSYDTSAYISKLHLRNFNLLLIVIGLHIAANFLYLWWKKINLITPMVSGRKAPQSFADQNEARFGSPLLAVFCLLLAAACVLGAIKLAGGRLF